MNQMAVCVWMDGKIKEAAEFYASVFKDTEIMRKTQYNEEGQEITNRAAGEDMTVEMKINGMNFLFLNGGPQFKPNEAMSVMVYCDTQEDIDYHFEKLSAVPEAEQCGWLKDKYGLSWQIVPPQLDELLSSGTKQQSEAVMAAMLKMHKLNIAELQAAYDSVK